MRAPLAALALTLLLPAAGAAAATPVLHAHRGGALSFSKPDQYEDTLDAFQRRGQQTPGVWWEMDAGVSKDGVPFVIHDSTLDRTTTCTGALLDRTAAEIEACRVDVLGVASELPGTEVPAPSSPVVRVPRLAAVLAQAKASGASVNLEIKRIPGDPGYTPGDTAFATRVMDVVAAAQLDPAKLIIQSFDPTNLDVAKAELPGVQTSYLTLAGQEASGLALCSLRGYDWLSPSGAPSAQTVASAHALGVKVVPYTLDTDAAVKAAAAAGVDALITDDVPLARRALGLPELGGVTGPTGATAATGATGVAGTSPGLLPGPGGTAPVVGTGPKLASRAPSAVLVDRRRATVLLRGKLTALVSGPRGATIRLRVSARGTLLARGRSRLHGAARRRVALRLTPAGQRVLAGARGPVQVRLVARVGSQRILQRVRLRP